MAKKRMFSTDILESDAFTSMSTQSQMLYVHLSMYADDDGFLSNAQWIMRAVGIPKKYMQELLDKRFLLDMGNDVTCIKHWRINNTIRTDRYKPTVHQDKLATLFIKENGAYTDRCTPESKPMTTNPQPCGDVDKISIGKVSKGKYNTRKRLPDFHEIEGEPTDINDAREKLFGKENS